MKTQTHDLEIQVVIQFGGTKGEQYLHSFDDEVAAKKFIRSASRAAYRCLGPFPIALPGVGNLVNAAKKVANWARRGRLKSQHIRELARSLATLKKEFR
jgi:hypothetical protein